MRKLQFRILYREFLFRVVDLELLSPQGDITKLLGQFAALLIFIGMLFTLALAGFGGGNRSHAELLVSAWPVEHLLIATTMLVVGLFAVLSWDSIFPDRRDVLVIAPLPVSVLTMFLAKVAASATALAVAVVALNALTGLIWPLATAPSSRNVLELVFSPVMYRSFFAYWLTMLLAGAFLFGCVLSIQGLAAQLLPRAYFLRVSAVLQMAAFCVLVSVYFLQPSLARPEALAAPHNQKVLAWLPSYWFLGLFQDLNGSMHPVLAPLAKKAWISLAIVACGTAMAYALSYFRTIRKIVEEPDIRAGARSVNWLPRFGNQLETAVTQFSVRSLLRSRQHRVILAFYLGVGFAITVLYLRTNLARQQLFGIDPWRHVNTPLVASSIILLCVWVVGVRIVSAMPLDARANWLFRIVPLRSGREFLSARRRSLIALSAAPASLCAAAAFLAIWPAMTALAHALILTILGITLVEVCLLGTQKIPFTCSYLPGRTNFHIAVVLCALLVMPLVHRAANLERRALSEPGVYAIVIAVLAAAMLVARWQTSVQARAEGTEVEFDEIPSPAVQVLGL